jgi:hypothetical protein
MKAEILEMFMRLSNATDCLRSCEKSRKEMKEKLRSSLRARTSINRTITLALAYKSALKAIAEHISKQRVLHNLIWEKLNYNDKVQYRYWINKEKFPGEDQTESQAKKTVYYKIDRNNAQKLCGKLIEFLSGQDQYFKVGLNESDAS